MHSKSTSTLPTLDFSLIIPTLNERDNIITLINQVESVLGSFSFEIIVVDDDSPDQTWAIVQEYSKSHPHVRVLRRQEKNGLSAAVISGFDLARGRVLGVMDADLSHDEKILPRLIAGISNSTAMAVGSRRIKGGGADHWPWFRRLYSGVATKLSQILLNSPLNDPMSGFFVLRRDIFEAVRPELNPQGYKILLEIVVRAQIKDVLEVPYIFKDRKQGVSKLTTRVAYQYVRMLWDLRSYFSLMHLLRKTYHTGRYKKVVRYLKEGKTLDIGCGRPCETMPEQSFLRFLNRPNSEGLDIKPMSGPYTFHQGSVMEMPLANESFDNVVAMEVFEHIDNVDKGLDEVHRILKPGGVFVMSTPDCFWVWDMLWDIWTKVIGQMWHDAHVVNLRASGWKKKLERLYEVKSLKRHWGFDLVFNCVKK